MAERLEGKIALITGGGTGIGKACAELFAAEGARVVISGRRAAPLEQVASAINEARGEKTATTAPGDIATGEGVTAMLDAAVNTYGGVDVLVNNAGVFEGGSLFDVTEEQIDRMFAINVKGPTLLAQRAARLMMEEGAGSIVNISSTIGILPVPGVNVYCATKAALNNLTRSWALDLAPYNVRCNCVCPGVVDTPIHQPPPGVSREEQMIQFESMHPIGRVGQPIDIAQAALYFASDESTWTTGSVLEVDGGISAGFK